MPVLNMDQHITIAISAAARAAAKRGNPLARRTHN